MTTNLQAELDATSKKLDVAKSLLKDQDVRLARFESLDIDATLADLAKYESMGTVADLKAKLESKGNEMSDTQKKFESDAVTLGEEDAALLARYKELGTLEELEELAERLEESEVISKDEAEEMEETKEKLESYRKFGTLAQLKSFATDYEEIKTKQESVRLAQEYGITEESAAAVIAKTESVAQAESILDELSPKHESNNRRNSHVEKQLHAKHESATVVTGPEAERLAKLRQVLKHNL